MDAVTDPLEKDEAGHSRWFDAVRAQDIPAIRSMLDAGLKADARAGDDEATALQLAIRAKNLDLIRLLVDYGADPALKTGGRNAYHDAASSSLEIMEYLLRHPARAAAEEFFKDGTQTLSPLRVALKAGDRAMVTLLLDYGIDVNEKDDDRGETPLHFIIGHRKSREETMPLIRLLVDRGADLEAKAMNYWDETPLFSAVRDSYTEGVRYLLDLGGNAATKNYFGETLLHAAAETYDADNVRMLVKGGAELEAKNRVGRTALHIAAHANRLEVVKALLEAGADPFAKDKSGKTPDMLCPADFQKTVHREIIRKQMELEARQMHQPHGSYYDRQRQRRDNNAKNRSFRPGGNRR